MPEKEPFVTTGKIKYTPGKKPSYKYAHVRDTLRGRIMNSNLGPGSLLPTEDELSKEFAVSSITVKRALNDLSNEGFIDRKPGKGTFVSDYLTVSANKESIAQATNLQCTVLFLSCGQLYQEYVEFLSGVENELGNHECSLLYSSVMGYDWQETARLKRLIEQNSVGVVLITGFVDDESVRFVKSLGLPVIVIGDYPITEDASQIYCNIREVSYRAVDMFLASGLRHIGLLNGAHRYGVAAQMAAGFHDRTAEYKDQIKQLEVAWYDDLMGNPQHAIDLLDELNKPAGVLVLNSHARELLAACETSGLSVPKDIQIIAYRSEALRYNGGQMLSSFVPNIEAELPAAVFHTIRQLMDKSTNYTVKCCISVDFVPGDSFVLPTGNESYAADLQEAAH